MRILRNLLGLGEGADSSSDHSSTSVVAPVPPKLKVGWVTDVGEVRRHNEDTALVVTAAYDGDGTLPPIGLFVLADGMGGHRSGEVASSLAARVAAHQVVEQFYLPTLVRREHNTDQPALNEMLVEAVQAANTAVAEQVAGGGTTLTCALALGTRIYVAHVGDSRAYVVTDETLDQITHDHSLVDRLVEMGQLTQDEAANHPQKNVLYRAVGQGGTIEVDTFVRTVPPGGYLLLCSDGLWGSVDEGEIAGTITASPSPQGACKELVAAANRAGGRDNITAILAQLPLG